jgi:hypothetical protein
MSYESGPLNDGLTISSVEIKAVRRFKEWLVESAAVPRVQSTGPLIRQN